MFGLLLAVGVVSLLALVLIVVVWRQQRSRIGQLTAALESLNKASQQRLEQEGERTRDTFTGVMDRQLTHQRLQREEIAGGYQSMTTTLVAQVTGIADRLAAQVSGQSELQQQRLTQTQKSLQLLVENTQDSFRNQQQVMEQRLADIRTVVDNQLATMRESNEKKLEEMRVTVDEKLQGALERRLGESFKSVSERLEQVHRGLGEMRTLAVGVGDLKKVMNNVKTRGTWGEVQLGTLLEQVLAPAQFSANVATKPSSRDRVEYAIKLPGSEEGKEIWLPIDAKFPQEPYLQLRKAREDADPAAVRTASKRLRDSVKASALTIREKYVEPPSTTDFALMFVPTEGLYAEIASQPDTLEMLQRDFRIMVAGPSNLAALLNSLQLGFRTLAIQKRSSEVWDVLSVVKTEFRKFGEVLSKVETKLSQAQRVIGDARRRERAMHRSLKEVDELPSAAQQVLKLGG